MRLLVTGAFLTALVSATPTEHLDVYDYIVVGSGPGGGPLAANLARAGHSVLLLEAGGDNSGSLLDRVPIWGSANAESDNASWQFFVHHYQNETQARRDDKYTYQMPNGTFYVGLDPPEGAEPLGIFYPRGATVGGSSQVNAMNLALPPDSEWRDIAALTGDDSWLPDHIRDVYTRLERNHYMPEGTPGYGFDGWLDSAQNNASAATSRPSYLSVLTEAVRRLEGREIESEEEMIELLQRDLNRPDEDRYDNPTVYRMPVHVNEQRERVGARTHVMNTVNAQSTNGTQAFPLTLSTQSLATKVLITEGKGKGKKPKAYGVEYLKGEAMYSADRRYDGSEGELKRAYAKREVIVSGGAFNTPQILKLSGVGPREELEALDIPVIVDLPAVGNYLQDNYESGIIVQASSPWENPMSHCTLNPFEPETDPCHAEWLQGRGPYGEAGAALNMLFRSSVSNNDEADILFFGNAGVEFRGFYPDYSLNLGSPLGWSWSMVKMQVGNDAGTVTLRSKNPRDTPLINFNYFERQAEQDIQAFTEGYEFAMELFEVLGEPFAPFTVVEPNPEVSMRQSIMDHTFGHHVSSSCRMGPKDDSKYCVDSKFKVNGVDGLRVVDASVFPRTPGAFTVGPTFIISQKAFEVIQEELGL